MASTPSRELHRALVGFAFVGRHPADLDLGVVGEAAGAQGLRHGQVGIRQVDVLPHEGNFDLVLAGCGLLRGACPSWSSPRP